MEPENAFWPQARFLFGFGQTARSAWTAASRCKKFDDHQTEALDRDRGHVAAYVGGGQAWTYGSVVPRRSEAMARNVVYAAARDLRNLEEGPSHDRLACENIRNGALLRDGSRELRLGQYGIDLIEGATYPSRFPAERSPRRLWSAKTKLTARLRASGQKEEAVFCEAQFRINDGWQAFRSVQDTEGRFGTLLLLSVLAGTLPGGFLVAALAGAFVGLFGRRIARVAKVRDRFRGPGLTAFSLTLLVSGFGLGYPLVGFAAALACLIPALGPERPRAFDGSPLGPLHAFVVGSMALSLLVLVTLVAVARSLPGRMLPQAGEIGRWISDADRLGAGIVVLLGASALVAPAWAVVRRIGTPAVAALTYRDLGRATTFVALALAIVLSPLSFAADRWLAKDLRKIAQNEQIYYNPSEPEGP